MPALAAIPGILGAIGGGSAVAGGVALAGTAATVAGALRGGSKATPAPQPLIPGLNNAYLYGNPNSGLTNPAGTNNFRGGPNQTFGDIYQSIANARVGSGVPGGRTSGPIAIMGSHGGRLTSPVTPSTPTYPNTGGIVPAGQQGISELQSLSSGVGFNDLFNSIIKARDYYQKQGQQNLATQFGAMGMVSSGPLAEALNNYNLQFGAETEAELGQLGLQTKALQESASAQLAQQLGQAAMSYYQPGYTPNSSGSILAGGANLLATLLPIIKSLNEPNVPLAG